MRATLTFLAMAGAAAALGALAGCGEAEHEHDHEGEPAAASAPQTEIAQKTCPVMGAPINPDIYVDHEGRRVYFCCPGCPEAFKKDPEKYLARLDEAMEGAGKAAPAMPEGTAPKD